MASIEVDIDIEDILWNMSKWDKQNMAEALYNDGIVPKALQADLDEIEGRNGVQTYLEHELSNLLDKIWDNRKFINNTDLETLKEAHSQKDVTKVDEASNKLNETWGVISTRLYQQTESQPEQPVNEGDNIEDVSYEDVTEK